MKGFFAARTVAGPTPALAGEFRAHFKRPFTVSIMSIDPGLGPNGDTDQAGNGRDGQACNSTVMSYG